MAPARVQKCSVFRPVVIGNIATPLGHRKDPASDHTHEWTVSVKGVNNDDVSYFIKKVVFKLHDSYANSARSIEIPPFEVTETGWGEFDIQIKIFFVQEASEKPVILYHRLKLHPYGPDAEKTKAEGGPVTSYQYDELVFNEPTETMYEIFASKSGAILPLERSKGNLFCQRSEQEELDRLESAIAKIDEQTKHYKEKILAMEKLEKRDSKEKQDTPDK